MNLLRAINVIPLLGLLVLSQSYAASPQIPKYGQTLFGKLKLNDNTIAFESNDETIEGELPDSIPYLGAMVQAPTKDDTIGYGWEGGGFFSWQNENVNYFVSSGTNGGTVKVSVDNQYWSFETFMGLYASIKPIQPLRFYLSAGPLFMLSTAKIEDATEEPVPNPLSNNSSTIIINFNERDYDFSVGAYARTGFDIQINKDFWIGASARYMTANIDLKDSIGEFDIDGTLYFLSLTKRM